MSRSFSGARLEQLRGRITQTDLANSLRKHGHGTTQTTISRWESGQVPHASVLPTLAAALGCTVDELFDEDDEEAAPVPAFDHDSILDVLIGALQAAKTVQSPA